MKRHPLVCVLILNWNRWQVTSDCIASVLKSTYPNFRVVVIDNGSTDNSVSALRARFGDRIKIIENETNLGYARGFNAGLMYGFVQTSADFCLVMNNDTIIDSRSVSELVKVAVTDNKIGFTTGKVYYYDNPNTLQTVGKYEHPIRWNGDHIGNREEDKGQYDKVIELHFADDIFTLISKSLYEDIGGYDPMFFLQGEEYDWQARAKKRGYRIMYTPFAKLWHRESMTIGRDSALKAYYDARNPMLVVLLHKSPLFFRKYFWFHLRIRVIRSSLVALKHYRIAVGLAKWQGFFSGLLWGIKKKKLTLRHLC